MFPIGAAATLDELEADPHPLLARLCEREPVSWLPALGGWLVTRREPALHVMRDPATFTVDDPRFSTGQVVGPSMLTLDGAEHGRHRDPFARPFRLDAVRDRFTTFVESESDRLIDAIEPAGHAELRRSLAGPLAVAVVAHTIGLAGTDAGKVLGWYDAIVESVTGVAAGSPVTTAGSEAFAALSSSIEPLLERDPASSLVAAAASGGGLTRAEVVSNVAVLLFGGIETTEGMIANAILHLLAHPAELALVKAEPSRLRNAVEESLRLEPAAAVIDRYATRDVQLGVASIGGGESRHRLDRRSESRPSLVRRAPPLRCATRARPPPHRLRPRPARLHRHAPRPPRSAHGDPAAPRASASPSARPGASVRAPRARLPQATDAPCRVGSVSG